EPTRFGIGCTGSRVMSGAMSPEELCELCDSEGDNYDVVRRRAGFEGELAECRLAADYYAAFVELHIEQGSILEQEQLDIGIVTAIAAPATAEFVVTGEGGHAGGVLMPVRRDALAAASDMIVAIEFRAKSSKSPELVATVGCVEVHPGAVNSIPSRVRFTLDLRDIDGVNRDLVLREIGEEIETIAVSRNVAVEW